MAEHREYVVELVVTTEHNYSVLARTPEEAVSIAEDLFDNGDDGTIIATSIEMSDAATIDSVPFEDFADSLEFEEEDIE